jgi:RNA polymerase sigma factor (sigma-70 family)
VTPTPDAPIWAAALCGDGAAFASLFDRHRRRVFQYAFHLVRSQPDAEDVVAVVFLELWRRREHVPVVEGSILPWLLVTTTNVCRNLRRGKERYRRLLERLPRTVEKATDPADVALDEHCLGIDDNLVAALRELPSVDRQLIALVAIDGYSLRDAALAVGLSIPSAKSRLFRSRKRLRLSLDGQELLQVGETP